MPRRSCCPSGPPNDSVYKDFLSCINNRYICTFKEHRTMHLWRSYQLLYMAVIHQSCVDYSRLGVNKLILDDLYVHLNLNLLWDNKSAKRHALIVFISKLRRYLDDSVPSAEELVKFCKGRAKLNGIRCFFFNLIFFESMMGQKTWVDCFHHKIS